MVSTALDLAKNVDKLASFPEVAFRIDEVLADERSSAADIGALIEPDPALSAALLRIANSAAYCFHGPIDTIGTAVRVVGSRELRDLVYAISATETFKGLPNDLVSVEDFWRHSLYCAAAAQILANTAKVCRGKSLFTAGLLHDIGHLAMFSQYPDLSKQALLQSLDDNDGTEVWRSEREVFGFDHMEVGLELARRWRFPGPLREAIGHHHMPFQEDGAGTIAMLVHIANSIAVLAELDSTDIDDAPAIDDRVYSELGIGQGVIFETIEQTRESTADLLSLFVN